MRQGKGKIIEFVGPPGSGKTTSTQVFAEELKKRGLIILARTDLKRYVSNKKITSKILLVVKTLFFKGYLLICFALLLAKHKIFTWDAISRYLKISIFDVALSSFKRKQKFDLIILDQWIIQEIWSATIFNRTNYLNLHKHMKRFYFKTDAVMFFEADAVTTSARIGFRQNGLSRFDTMLPQVRHQQIEKYNLYLFQLFTISDCRHKHVLKADQSLSYNVPVFIRNLNVSFKWEIPCDNNEVSQENKIHKTIEL